jgi:hypothetical protein
VVVVTGLAVGSTSITLNATIESTTLLAFDDDENIALPFNHVNGTPNVTLSVRVVRCEYRVDISGYWLTAIEGINTMIRVDVHDFPLTSTGGQTLEYEPRVSDRVRWQAIVNRVRGCLASSEIYGALAPALSMRGDILGDEVNLTLSIYQQDGQAMFPCIRRAEDQTNRTRNCEDYLDGECDPRPPAPMLTPDSISLRFPVDGGTRSVSVGMAITRGGNPQGRISITLTPVESQP